MKPTADLNALIPTILEELGKEEHEIGDYNQGEYETNHFYYDDDNWYIEITYKCTGRWYYEPDTFGHPGGWKVYDPWGEVEKIEVTYYDENGDEINFTEEDLKSFKKEVDGFLACLE